MNKKFIWGYVVGTILATALTITGRELKAHPPCETECRWVTEIDIEGNVEQIYRCD